MLTGTKISHFWADPQKYQTLVKNSHLMKVLLTSMFQVEERYTQEAVLADQRVSGLKQETANLQEQLKTTSHQGALQRYTHTHTRYYVQYNKRMVHVCFSIMIQMDISGDF